MHGVDLLLPLMHEQEVAQAVIHARFAYGAQGKEPDIPPDCALECDIHLMQVQRIDSESELHLQDRIKYGESACLACLASTSCRRLPIRRMAD